MPASISCEFCKLFFEPNYHRNTSIINFDDLRDNVPSKCETCRVVWCSIAAILGEYNSGMFGHLKIMSKKNSTKGPLRVDLVPRQRNKDIRNIKLQFLSEASPWGRVGSLYPVASSGLAASCLSLCSLWLQACIPQDGRHPQCQAPLFKTLPTRLLEIVDEKLDLRLYSSRPGDEIRYTALSHCWGAKGQVRTTTANIHTRSNGIAFNSLPQTFRDAVLVTYKLGIQFLWIDSLCIIQDSTDDWEAESARMASVYQNAFFTISADAAPDSTFGFLEAPARQPAPLIKTDYTLSDNNSGSLHVRERGTLAWKLPFHDWYPGSMASPDTPRKNYCFPPDSPRSKLSTRGWVFQERILAPRTLHFAERELAWECKSVIACECTATSERSHRGESLLKRALVEQSWEELVEEFSALDLTVLTDRLPAISGLAKATQDLNPKDQYICGLWKNKLAIQLLWSTVNMQPTQISPAKQGSSERIAGNYAPTWSWASISGAVRFACLSQPELIPKISIMEILCQTRLNPYGSPERAYIVLSGLAVSVKVSMRKRRSAVISSGSLSAKAIFDVDAIEYLHGQTDFGLQLLFLLVAEGKGAPRGLLLLASHGEDKGSGIEVYRRVGYGSSSRNARAFGSFRSFKSEEGEHKAQNAWHLWEEKARVVSLKLI